MGGGTDKRKEPRYSAREIQAHAAELKLGVPYAARIVGDRIEYHTRDAVICWPEGGHVVLLGGKAARVKSGVDVRGLAQGRPTAKNLAGNTKATLASVASVLDIPGRSAMTKGELIRSIRTAQGSGKPKSGPAQPYTPDHLGALLHAQLVDTAAELGIKGRTKMRKADLVKAILGTRPVRQ